MYKIEVHKLPAASKVVEDRKEYSAYNSQLGVSYAFAFDTYVDSGANNMTEFRIVYEARCDEGLGWAIKVEDDAGNVLYENDGSNTTYQTFDSGWRTLTSTRKLKVYVGAYSDGEVGETGYIRNVRIYVR